MENSTAVNATSVTNTSTNYNLFFAILIPSICFLTVIGNLGTIYAFWRLPSLREKPSEFLILHLSFADLISGFLATSFFSPTYITPGQWPFGETGCRLVGVPFTLGTNTSLLLLLSISMDRFLLVFKEYPKYIKIQSKSRINMTIVCCWGIGVLSAVAEQIMWDLAKTIDSGAANIPFDVVCLSPPRRVQAFSLTLFLGLYFIPVMLVCGLSIAFLILLRARLIKNKVGTTQSTSHSTAPDNNSNNEQPSMNATGNHESKKFRARNRYIKPALSLIALVSGMAICMLPYSFYIITIELFCPECTDIDTLYALLLLQFCNAGLDPFLYALTQRKIQKLYCSCLTGNAAAG